MRQSGFSEHLIIQDNSARVGCLSGTYYDIAEEAYALFLAEEENLVSPPGPDEDPTKELEQIHRITIAGIKSIVFSAMCIEAAAFDFSATQLSDSYAEQYLDKLDLVSKWVVIPKLVCGRSLKENGPALNSLRALVRARNALVHQKSLPFKSDGTSLEAIEKASNAFPGNVHNAFKTIVLISLELNEIIGVATAGLPPFEKNIVSSNQCTAQIKRVIERCRVIHRRNSNAPLNTNPLD